MLKNSVLFVSNLMDSEKFQYRILSAKEWQQKMETESLLSNVLARSLQQEVCTSNSFSYFYVTRACTCISKISFLDVYNLDESWTPRTLVDKTPLNFM
jgi:hypothetical protein